MEYEKKLKLAKEALDSGSYDRETIEYIFPELKESKDERIRKTLIDGARLTKDITLLSYIQKRATSLKVNKKM